MHKYVAAEIGKSGKSGTPSQKRDKWASRESCDFPGHIVKNQDCPGKSGLDGHLMDMEHHCEY